MTVKSFFPDATVLESHNIYHLVSINLGIDRIIDRRTAAQMQADSELPGGFHIEWETVTRRVPACPWCGARPLVFEPDCDGPASTGTCGSELCDRLRRCEGCGTDGSVRYGSVRGRLCVGCDKTARRYNLTAARDRYALIPATW